ncbi:MAG: GNAT family N-acetyltransferase [Acidobacteria bacterium]|nr:MAG: GNAT family N-acetyltransferase [Acidobacteriota bacterium]
MIADEITAPERLNATHDISSFDSGVSQLDEWLKRHALANEQKNVSRTYVVCAKGRVVGYYTLANGAIAHAEVRAKTKRNLPNPIPVMVLGRLAVDKAYQDHHLGSSLLRDAILRTLQAAEIAGIRAMLVQAISENAKKFYEHCGFSACAVDPMTLMITLTEIKAQLESEA